MKIRVVTAGKPALAFAKQGVEEYRKRLGRLVSFDWQTVKAGDSTETSTRLLERSETGLRVAMDERGELLTTRQWSDRFTGWEMRGDIKCVSFLIGAADGHTAEFRRQSDAVWALSPLTLQHEVALLVLMEQLYRVASIKAGSPYHRD